MTVAVDPHAAPTQHAGLGIFALAVFFSAALVFTVEPMAAKLLLPKLGGSAAVWNTSLAFFQAALLVGYAYAHLLQRIGSMRRQMIIHLAVLAVSALVLPLRISQALGDPSVTVPAAWTFGVLTLSLGAPFAALSATAPLIQAWYARTHGNRRDPYVLYAASNLGSLLALLAYPLVIEPFSRLRDQAVTWSLAYVAFAVLIAALAGLVWRGQTGGSVLLSAPAAAPASWRQRIIWLLLAAAPSSLLLGVTGHLTADVASAPFLWVIPLALYLLTFIIAFQARPLIGQRIALLAQLPFPAAVLILVTVPGAPLTLQFLDNALAFFLTALVCAHALAERRPPPARLTEFYLWMSLGGVVGGAFNAFVAPTIFNGVWEYPIVLVLACLARPWGRGPLTIAQMVFVIVGVLCALVLLTPLQIPAYGRFALLLAPALFAIPVMDRAPALVVLLAALAAASYLPNALHPRYETHRSFFGVVQIADAPTRVLGTARVLVHGSTLHGSQGLDPAQRCRPTTYYAAATPIGQVLRQEQARRPDLAMGAIGLGTGTVAAYIRPSDRLRFFEIDPLVARIALDPAKFTYINGCAKGPVSVTLGDARLTLNAVSSGSYDVLLVDAFSSDSVPTHLMTVEAMRTYLRVLKPDGVVVLHLSNRNLELSGPAAAAMKAAGGAVLEQTFYSQLNLSYVESSSQAIVAARDPRMLDAYRTAGWGPPSHQARAWTDDYTNVAGALWTRLREGRAY